MKLASVEEIANRRRNAQAMLEGLLSSPAGKDLIYILESELKIDQALVGVDTHDTYFNLGKKAALDTIKNLGGL